MLTPKEVGEFKKLVLEVYGVELTDEQAADQGTRLIQLFELVLRYEKKTKELTMNLDEKVVKHE